jgi:hypothetical protein
MISYTSRAIAPTQDEPKLELVTRSAPELGTDAHKEYIAELKSEQEARFAKEGVPPRIPVFSNTLDGLLRGSEYLFDKEETASINAFSLADKFGFRDESFDDALTGKQPEMADDQTKGLFDLKRHDANDDATLVGNRYLCRQGGMLLVAPTGIGKSVMGSMQFGIAWALGRETLGFKPRGAMRVLILQAENDEGDMSEMRDGVAEGLFLTNEEKALVNDRVRVRHVNSHAGENFISLVEWQMRTHKPDILIIDPLLAFLGGDASSQKDVSKFLREGLNPLLEEFQCGAVIIHHTNKPIRDPGKAAPAAGDFAYLGTGSAEFANWARAVISIVNVGSHEIFKLVAGKRGKRLGWRDDDGSVIYERHIKHASGGGIFWLDATDDDVATLSSGTGAQRKSRKVNDPAKLSEIIALSGVASISHSDLKTAALSSGIKEGSFKNVLRSAIEQDIIVKDSDGLYAIPEGSDKGNVRHPHNDP